MIVLQSRMAERPIAFSTPPELLQCAYCDNGGRCNGLRRKTRMERKRQHLDRLGPNNPKQYYIPLLADENTIQYDREHLEHARADCLAANDPARQTICDRYTQFEAPDEGQAEQDWDFVPPYAGYANSEEFTAPY